jgi:hypothetical protein
MHRGCALLATDIFDLLDFPDLSSISIKETITPIEEVKENVDTVVQSSGIVETRNYNDLFGDSLKISSRPSDLFDDYPKSTLKDDDLFSDYQNTAANDNIFDDYPSGEKLENEDVLHASTKELKESSESLVTHFDLQDAIRIGFETRQLIVLKKCIIMRVLAVYNV